jgi:hypothetical protein
LRDPLGEGPAGVHRLAYDTVGGDLAGCRLTPLRLDAIVSTDVYETPARDYERASSPTVSSLLVCAISGTGRSG